MAAARGGIKSNPDLLSVAFNQDQSCIATGTRKGYTITNCEPFGKVYARTDGATSIVEMLFCTSLVALVGAGDRPSSSTRRLQIVNTKRQSTICELTFPTTILAVKLNRRRLVVVLEEKIYVYDISNMKLLHEIETSPNPNAICSLSPSSENSYLAYPSPLPSPTTPFSGPSSSNSPSSLPNSAPSSSSSTGDILLFDAVSLSVTNLLRAHKSPLSHISINQSGTLLASSSEKGTVIRVFGLPDGEKKYEFRRGSYSAKIWSIGFNLKSTLMAVSSDTETVHIFKLGTGNSSATRGGGGGGAGNDWENGEDRYSSSGSSQGMILGGGGGDLTTAGYDAIVAQKRKDLSSSAQRKKSLSSLTRGIAGGVSNFLPSQVTGLFDPQRDFAYLKLPVHGVKSIVGISSTSPQIMVVTSEGLFYSYSIDLEKGGECILQKSYSLLDGIDSNGSGIGSGGANGGL
ncbi:phosphoinositide binding protein ATG18 [Sporobolomyces salmoneus]|uniref:phosphoinositide binding protein ATG18 n=1 Tax=Sporobolomyces salmoneus TaxID=183962 RepID=UPI00317CFF3C